jgi:hypothetical protein
MAHRSPWPLKVSGQLSCHCDEGMAKRMSMNSEAHHRDMTSILAANLAFACAVFGQDRLEDRVEGDG